MLINTNYLPADFSSTNSFGQTILGLARKPNPNQLEAIVVTTGGQTIPEMGIRAIAENLGGLVDSFQPLIRTSCRVYEEDGRSHSATTP